MARIPKEVTVFETPGLWVPLVQTENVLILPGVPLLFKKMIDNWFENELPNFVKRGDLYVAPRIRVSVKTQCKESDIAAKLTKFQDDVKQFGISLGSYPKLYPDGSTFVVISVSGTQDVQNEIDSIVKEIINSFNGKPL